MQATWKTADAQARGGLGDLRGAPLTDSPAPASTLPRESPSLRAFDLLVCLLVLPFVLPLAAVIALLIYIDSPGSVLYRSTRVGRDGHHFQMLKFRKMRRTATGGPLTVHNDERFTPIGSFLSLTKLDELPQLWNVIRGEMHLVGPRPEVPEFVARYPREYHDILSVLPGITGPAAVEYASESHLLTLQHDPLRYYEEQIMPRKLEIDLRYIRSRTLASDVSLLLRTALVPLAKVLRGSRKHPRARRVEASLLLGACALLVAVFALATTANARAATARSSCTSLYCVPQQSIFTFTRVAESPKTCSVQVSFTVKPAIKEASGYAHLELRGASRSDKHVDKTARRLVSNATGSYKFTKLRAGAYKLTGWYEGTNSSVASTHGTKSFTLRCG
jgi:lipopolysaccharide/colanic/teichoic acid biosynthesis glycosyltransferase